MELTIGPRGILQIDDAKIVYRNFKGEGSKYNREGDRNFSLIIPNREIADKLIEEGWNVKIKPSNNDEEDEFITLPVKVKFNDRGPQVFIVSGESHRKLKEDTVAMLDDIDIASVDLDIRPYDWTIQEGTPNEKSGRTAYLQSIKVIQNIDRISAQFAEEESPEE